MKERAISVTEAARNFADCVNRVRYQGLTYILHKNGVPVARIIPEPEKPNAEKKQEATAGAEPGEASAAEQVIAAQPHDPRATSKPAHLPSEITRRVLHW